MTISAYFDGFIESDSIGFWVRLPMGSGGAGGMPSSEPDKAWPR